MDIASMELYGESLYDFLRGDISATLTVRRDDGYTGDMAVSTFFRKPSDFSPLEQMAMKLCRGEVLDVGAGAGSHSLALQARGTRVLAIDISPHAVDIMVKRGVKNVQRVDVFEFPHGQFDTLLTMMHGIGLVEDLSGLDRFLHHAHKLLKPDGQIICDSLDVRYTDDPRHQAYQKANQRAGHLCWLLGSSVRFFGDFMQKFSQPISHFPSRVGSVHFSK